MLNSLDTIGKAIAKGEIVSEGNRFALRIVTMAGENPA